MPQMQRNLNIGGPGFAGLNTQDSPIELPVAFAAVANNCVIDSLGRIAARKGLAQYTQNPDILNGNPIEATESFTSEAGVEWLFACGDNKIFYQQLVSPFNLVVLTLPASVTVTGNNWQIQSLNDQVFFVQAGQSTLVFTATTGVLTELTFVDEATTGFPSCCTAAYGRMWYSGFDNDLSVVMWSALLDGDNVTGLASSLDLRDVWPSGYDIVKALHVHNNFMIFFGERSIVLYSIDPAGPAQAGTQLVDTVEGIGCISRDSVRTLGTAIWFLDATGIRDFGRTVQEKSLPISDISYNVRSDLKFAVSLEDTDNIGSVYDPEEALYGLFLPASPKTYIFDTRRRLEDGTARTTQWTNTTLRCATRADIRKTWYGGKGGLFEYTGYSDTLKPNNSTPTEVKGIPVQYQTHPLTFGEPANVKFPKQVDVVIIGGAGQSLTLDWSFDYSTNTKSSTKTPPGSNVPGWYNLNVPAIPDTDALTQYDLNGNYNAGSSVRTLKYNIWGSGNNITLGFQTENSSFPFSFQELNIQALMGRIL